MMKYQFKTNYKNIKKTILLAVIIGIISYAFLVIFLPVPALIQRIVAIVIGLLSLLLIGRTIIVRHEIRKNNLIIIEFLFRPRHQVIFGPDKVNNIKYIEINWGRYGRYTKGIIMFKEKLNNKPIRFRDFLESELTWFWMK